ncbi:hypothetical protein APHAL10511_008048 [Amanita phalloides]|nr:hypothetical protein APHAL10511_008048 [Amanita phalloides]
MRKPNPIVPAAPPPTSRKPRKKPKSKSGPEASADIDDVDSSISAAPCHLDSSPEAERPSVPGEL